ncbi:hypothetical protein BU14_0614s0009 [Porphyra umbilicalis]|uniref:Ubiquitin-like protease family profile domain-containing protein n=1 Tax=Porphyra umbilicalis TaxID=2786 RepID=A0A1X6NR29_PORUM|nr:hypothetical protein BU14_0614s0009 [Porphyra umbilicalis]|eukprot:OSX71035.1 hypothetical protein BU14_0614s0009 [Porphyra umbilicalis]
MAPVPQSTLRATRLRALLRVLLGVSSLPSDVDGLVSVLVQTLVDLEERCPSLCCHFHLSGVSKATGKAFFVVLYDAALSAHEDAKRVIQTVYTHIHSELSMTTTSGLFRRSLRERGCVPAAPREDEDRSTAHGDGDSLVASAFADATADVAPRGSTEDAVQQALAFDPEGDAAGAPPPAADAPLPAPGARPHAADAPPAAAVGLSPPVLEPTFAFFKRPDIHFPSEAGIWVMEALFTAVQKGWVGPVRETVTVARNALLHKYGVSCRAFIQGKLPWWPVDMGNTRASADVGGTVRCMHFPFPVAVQRRHLPTGERTRDVDNVEEAMVTLVEIGTSKTPDFNLVVAVLLLLFDKERGVRVAICDRLAMLGVKLDPSVFSVSSEAVAGLTINDHRLTDGFGLAPGTPRTPSTASTPPYRSPTGSPSPANGAPGADMSTLAAARMAARRAAGAAGREAAAADRLAKAQAAAARASLKRSADATAQPSAKKPKGQARRSAVDLELPILDASEDVVCLPLHAEAALLADHTFFSLATNWCPPVVFVVDDEIVIETVAVSDWSAFTKSQTLFECVLDDKVARSARKQLMEKAAAMRVGGEVDVDDECKITAKFKALESGDTVRVSMASLVAMGELHLAAERLQALRGVVAWVREAAVLYNSRVSTFYGVKESTTGELGTEVMQVVLKSNPNATVWRTDAQPEDAAEEDAGLTANRLVANLGDVWMSDDFLAVNQTILRRWLKKNKPTSYALPCSFFVSLLQPPRGPTHAAAVAAAVDAAAQKAFRLAGIVEQLAGVCNIDNSHWVAFAVHLPSKTVTLYDSGQHFATLRPDVAEAVVRVKAMGKRLRVLFDEAAMSKSIEEARVAGSVGGEGEGEQDKGAKKSWSHKKIKAPSQTDSTSCGAYAFSFVWHTLREEKSKVQAGDASAVRLEMAASLVRDGVAQQEAREERAARAAADRSFALGGADAMES